MVGHRMETARILVVDDSKVSRMLLTRELEQQGHQVASAEHGQQALAMLAETVYDLILLDVEMPEMDGYQTLAALKNDETLRHLPVIMVTAIDDLSSAVRCIEMGSEDYLPKPFNPVLLRARIGASLEKKRLRDQEQAYLKALERELEIGRNIQQGFLPGKLPVVTGWEIAASLEAAREVAGDFYDAFPVGSDGQICLVIGDVCDKGVGAALFMTLFRSLLRFTMEAASAFLELTTAEKLNYAVTLTNNYIANTHGDTGMFATIFLGMLEPESGRLTYINAGHEAPWIVQAGNLRAELTATGMAVGLMAGYSYQVEQAQLERGEVLLAFTDGIPDSRDPQRNPFGRDRLLALLEISQQGAEVLIEAANQALEAHIGAAEQYDDITLLVVRRL